MAEVGEAPEAQACREFFAKLSKAITHSEELAPDLYSEGLISQQARDEVFLLAFTERKKASVLLAAVEKTLSPERMDAFIRVLSEYPPLQEVARQLDQRVRELRLKRQQTLRPSASSTTSRPENDENQCPIRTRPDSEPQSVSTSPSSPAIPSPIDGQGQGMELRRQSTDSAIGSEGRQNMCPSPVSPVFSFSSSEEIPAGFFSEKEVRIKVEDLSQRFNEMSNDARMALQKKKISCEKVIYFIEMPDPYFKTREEHTEFLDTLKMASDVLDLFKRLNRYWDHFNYHLLKQLIMAPGIEKVIGDKKKWQRLQAAMKQYIQDMKEFRERTTLGIYYKVCKPKKEKVPASFQELVTKHNWPETKTLQDVENFRHEVAFKYQLHICLVFLKNIASGSVVITWWIPKALIVPNPQPEGWLFDDSDDDGLLMVSLEGKTIWMAETQNSQVSEDPSIELEPEISDPPLVTKTASKSQLVKSKETQGLVSTVLSTVSGLFVGNIPLRSAIRNQNVREVERLIAEGVDPNVPFAMSWTPLMEASSRGYTQVVQVLLEKGANPNMANHEGWTALMAASRRGYKDIVDQLLEHRANPDMQDHTGWSALMAAVFKSRVDIALRIIKAGATPHLQDNDGTNALFLAIALEQHKVIDALLSKEPQLNVQDKYGETVLITACKMKNLNVLRKLLKQNADPNIANNDGDTPLLLATARQETEMVEALLEAGAKPNEGTVPSLLLASSMGVMDIVRVLLSYGANPAIQDKYGTTASEVASGKHNSELAQMISPGLTDSRPAELLQMTLQAVNTVQGQLSRGPLFLLKEANVNTSWIRTLGRLFA